MFPHLFHLLDYVSHAGMVHLEGQQSNQATDGVEVPMSAYPLTSRLEKGETEEVRAAENGGLEHL